MKVERDNIYLRNFNFQKLYIISLIDNCYPTKNYNINFETISFQWAFRVKSPTVAPHILVPFAQSRMISSKRIQALLVDTFFFFILAFVFLNMFTYSILACRVGSGNTNVQNLEEIQHCLWTYHSYVYRTGRDRDYMVIPMSSPLKFNHQALLALSHSFNTHSSLQSLSMNNTLLEIALNFKIVNEENWYLSCIISLLIVLD